MSDIDFAKLAGALVPVAQDLLEGGGTFYPFGGTMNREGEIALLGAGTGQEHADSDAQIAFLSSALHARMLQDQMRMCGICINVSARLPHYVSTVDAICCQLEQADGRAVQIFVPFRRNLSGHYEYDKPISLPGKSSVFKAGPDSSK